MRRLPGKQDNSAIYYYADYIYYLDKRSSGTIFRCNQKNNKGCKATIYVGNLNDLENQEHRVEYGHNHAGDPLYLLKEQFKAELELAASIPGDNLIDIFDRVLLKDE